MRNKASTANKVMKTTPEMDALLRRSGSERRELALSATHELAKALEIPLRQGVLYGDVLSDIFQAVNFAPGVTIDFPLDFLSPGSEKNYVAYTIPNHGRIPERHIEGDIITVSTYEIAASIDWLLKYARDARWDIVSGAMRVLRGSFTKKLNDDGFHILLGAAVDRNVIVYDSVAAAGFFTKRLVSIMQQVMRRNAGGNSTSLNRGRLTDVFMSPEALENIRSWDTTQIDEVTRREIYLAQDGQINQVFGVRLHDLDEFGVGQQYQTYYTTDLGGTMASNDVEMLLGLDLSGGPGGNGSFMMPIREELQIFEDDNLHRQRRAGFYGWQEQGFTVLDPRRVVLASI